MHLPPGDTSMERTLQIDGSSEQIESAKQLVNEVISEVRLQILVPLRLLCLVVGTNIQLTSNSMDICVTFLMRCL